MRVDPALAQTLFAPKPDAATVDRGKPLPKGPGRAAPAAVIAALTRSDAAATTPDVTAAAVRADDPPLTVQGLLDDWGRSDSMYDLNGDQTVDVNDLLQLLATLGNTDDDTGAGDDGPDSMPLVNPVSGKTAPPAGDDDGNPSPTPNEPAMTLDGLLAAWGDSDSPYDLDLDGIVNVGDLLQWLAGNGPGPAPDGTGDDADPDMAPAALAGAADGAMPPPSDDAPGADSSDAASPPMTLDGLLAAWGDSDSPYDLNADQTVNVGDLLMWLASMGSPPDQVTAAATAAGTDDETAAVPGSPTAQSLYAATLDRTVSARQLVGALAQFIDGRPDTSSANARSLELGRDLPEVGRKVGLLRQGRLDRQANHLSDQIIERLRATGYGDRPPSTLRGLIDELDMSKPQKNTILQRLADAYPRGLGVNAVG